MNLDHLGGGLYDKLPPHAVTQFARMASDAALRLGLSDAQRRELMHTAADWLAHLIWQQDQPGTVVVRLQIRDAERLQAALLAQVRESRGMFGFRGSWKEGVAADIKAGLDGIRSSSVPGSRFWVCPQRHCHTVNPAGNTHCRHCDHASPDYIAPAPAQIETRRLREA